MQCYVVRLPTTMYVCIITTLLASRGAVVLLVHFILHHYFFMMMYVVNSCWFVAGEKGLRNSRVPLRLVEFLNSLLCVCVYSYAV